jgi:hypothetical protein
MTQAGFNDEETAIYFRSIASTSYEERTFGVTYHVGIPVVAAGAGRRW